MNKLERDVQLHGRIPGIEGLEQVVNDLFARVCPSRVTVRLLTDEGSPAVVAEVLGDGVESVAGLRESDVKAGATWRALEETAAPLIQADCANDPIAPPPELMRVYGIRAQILAPILDRAGCLRGVVSVHEARAPRLWSEAEVQAVTDAATEIAVAITTQQD